MAAMTYGPMGHVANVWAPMATIGQAKLLYKIANAVIYFGTV